MPTHNTRALRVTPRTTSQKMTDPTLTERRVRRADAAQGIQRSGRSRARASTETTRSSGSSKDSPSRFFRLE